MMSLMCKMIRMSREVAHGLFVALLLMVVASGSALATPSYTIVDLGVASSGGMRVNNHGEVAGGRAGVNEAFLYSGGHTQMLGTLPGDITSNAFSINDAGQVVGTSYSSTLGHAFLYSNGAMIPIGLGGTHSNGCVINTAGYVTGNSSTPESQADRLFVYNTSKGSTQDLGPMEVIPVGVSRNGQIAGYGSFLSPGGNAQAAILNTDGTVDYLGTLGGAGTNSFAYDINDAGRTVGYSQISTGGNYYAFVYDKGGTMMNLADLMNGASSEAFGVNEAGQVVGGGNYCGAYMYSDGAIVNLNTLLPTNSGWHLQVATDINDKGQIVGYGYHEGSSGDWYEVFLMTPTDAPEPSCVSLLLLATGLGAIAPRRRKRLPGTVTTVR